MVSDMTSTIRIEHLEQQIQRIKNNLLALGPLHPGSLSRQYTACGKAGCRCQDPTRPRRHGPYYKVSYVYRGRFTTRFVPRQEAGAVRGELANYKRMRKLIEAWVGLAIRLAKEKRQAARPA